MINSRSWTGHNGVTPIRECRRIKAEFFNWLTEKKRLRRDLQFYIHMTKQYENKFNMAWSAAQKLDAELRKVRKTFRTLYPRESVILPDHAHQTRTVCVSPFSFRFGFIKGLTDRQKEHVRDGVTENILTSIKEDLELKLNKELNIQEPTDMEKAIKASQLDPLWDLGRHG